MPTTTGSAVVTLPEDNQILITREFDAPAHLVWEAWTKPELVKRWWGAKRGDQVSAEIDFRVGGMWRYVMVATGDFEVAFHGEFKEIVEHERIVSTEAFEGLPPEAGDPDDSASLNTLTLTERDGRTKLEVLVEHKTKEHRDMHIESGMEGGMQESMDALEEVAVSLR